jgi:phage anti-repressor protein
MKKQQKKPSMSPDRETSESIISGASAPILTIPALKLHALVGGNLGFSEFFRIAVVTSFQRIEPGYGYGLREDGQNTLSLKLALALAQRSGDFVGLMTRLPLLEAISGEHSQKTLDQSLELCAELIPDPQGLVRLRKLHQFLVVREPFSLWSARFMKTLEPRQYQSDCRAQECGFSKDSKSAVSPVCRWDVAVSTALATEIAMCQPTPRARNIRRYFIQCEESLEPDVKKSWEAFLLSMTSDQSKCVPTETGPPPPDKCSNQEPHLISHSGLEDDEEMYTELQLAAAESDERHRQFLRIVSPSNLRFKSGRIFVTKEGIARLAQAILDGRIEGDADKARAALARINQRPSEPEMRLTPDMVRNLNQRIIDANDLSDIAKIREIFDQLRRMNPAE